MTLIRPRAGRLLLPALLYSLPCLAAGPHALAASCSSFAGAVGMPGMPASSAFIQNAPMAGMPGMSMPTAPASAAAKARTVKAKTKNGLDTGGMTGMDMSGMSGMSSSIDLLDPMNQEASGTAWLPSSSPMYGRMSMLNGDMLMLHGAIMPRYVSVGSRRGDRRFDAPNWGMAMFSHRLDSRSQLGLRAMVSLDPITEGGYGYPLLFQAGESWHHQPLHDRQHPHDLFSELAASYSRKVGGNQSAYIYIGYPGEPALGPPTFMHRILAYDLADAPIGHHWQDATHITFGVATAGINFGSKLKVESSVFTGREPDENRYSFDKPRFDSQSARVSFNPNSDNAYQVSYGFIKNAEGDGANQHRITASWLYNKGLGDDSNFTTALVWGQNNLTTEGKTNSYLAEADYQRGRNTVFTRVENIQKSGHELVLPEEALHDRKFSLGAYTVGYVRDLTHGKGIDTGLGFAVTADTHPSALNADYGGGTPLSFQVYLRLRPSRMKGMTMPSMDMAGPSPSGPANASPAPAANAMPGMDMPREMPVLSPPAAQFPAVAAPTVTAALAANPPKVGQKNLLTVFVTRPDGKPLAGATVKASVAMTSMDMGTTHPPVRNMGNGRYRGSVVFSMPGAWRVTLAVKQSAKGAPFTKTVDYKVAP